MNEKLLEKSLPLAEINRLGAREAGYKVTTIRFPKIHNIHTWFARRPAGTAELYRSCSLREIKGRFRGGQKAY